MKLWIDDVRTAPEGYVWVKSVNEAIVLIKISDRHIERCMKRGHECFLNRDYKGRSQCYAHANKWDIALIDVNYDAGEFISDGSNYNKLINWLEETGCKSTIRIH